MIGRNALLWLLIASPLASASAVASANPTASATPLETSSASSAFPPPSPELLTHRVKSRQRSSFHPAITLLDSSKQPVERSGGFVSFVETCGNCHDSSWIARRGYHFRVGVDEVTALGQAPSGRPWDFGPGLFGRWDPLDGYDTVLTDPTRHGTAIDAWITGNQRRLLGGGPASLGLQARAFEPNCAVCHVQGVATPRDRPWPLGALATASLEPLGLVRLTSDPNGTVVVSWNPDAFLADGTIAPSKFVIRRPTSEACGTCHGFAGRNEPRLSEFGAVARLTETTGQLFLNQRMNDSTLNLARREELGRPWDVHAERLVECSDCHFSPNDPSATYRTGPAQTEHLKHETRRLPLGEYLRRPSHEFAKGPSTQGHVANAFDGTMRRCEDCHDAPKVHTWLPKMARHLEQVACETCHIATLHAPARQVTDYTVVDESGLPRIEYRGVRGTIADPAAALTETVPVYLRRKDGTGRLRLVPYNVITSFYWVIDEVTGPRPASLALLKRAFYELPGAKGKLLAALDRNQDGRLDDGERSPTTATALATVKDLLVAAGAKNPRVQGEMEPYGIHHGVAPARFALKDCNACHSPTSRLSTPYALAEQSPHGLLPTLVKDSNVIVAFEVSRDTTGALRLRPNVAASGLHVFGLSRKSWLDTLGLLAIAVVFFAASGHGALRYWSAKRRNRRAS